MELFPFTSVLDKGLSDNRRSTVTYIITISERYNFFNKYSMGNYWPKTISFNNNLNCHVYREMLLHILLKYGCLSAVLVAAPPPPSWLHSLPSSLQSLGTQYSQFGGMEQFLLSSLNTNPNLRICLGLL